MHARRQALAISLIFGSFLASSSAVAQEQQKNFHATLGVKAWYNTWEKSGRFCDSTQSGSCIPSETAGPKLALIPALSLRYKNFFASGGYFTKTSYDFPTFSNVQNIGGTPTIVRNTTTGERSEYDVNLGYFVLPTVGITLGYKNIKQEFTQVVSTPTTTTTFHNSFKQNGPTLGLVASAPIGGRFNLYGNGAFGPSKYSTSTNSSGYYYSTELGIAYGATDHIAVTLGAKYAVLDFSGPTTAGGNGKEQRLRDVTSGFILGASYTF
jgi:hypothetical protein